MPNADPRRERVMIYKGEERKYLTYVNARDMIAHRGWRTIPSEFWALRENCIWYYHVTKPRRMIPSSTTPTNPQCWTRFVPLHWLISFPDAPESDAAWRKTNNLNLVGETESDQDWWATFNREVEFNQPLAEIAVQE